MNNTNTKRPMGKLLALSATILNINQMALTDLNSAGVRIKEARYLVYDVMKKEGYEPEQIAQLFNSTATEVEQGITKLIAIKADTKEVKNQAQRLEALLFKKAA